MVCSLNAVFQEITINSPPSTAKTLWEEHQRWSQLNMGLPYLFTNSTNVYIALTMCQSPLFKSWENHDIQDACFHEASIPVQYRLSMHPCLWNSTSGCQFCHLWKGGSSICLIKLWRSWSEIIVDVMCFAENWPIESGHKILICSLPTCFTMKWIWSGCFCHLDPSEIVIVLVWSYTSLIGYSKSIGPAWVKAMNWFFMFLYFIYIMTLYMEP